MYSDFEKRKHFRIAANFLISYRRKQSDDAFDLSQTKNISSDGALITTNRLFEKDTFLHIIPKFPFIQEEVWITGKVIDSKEVVKNSIYETHVQFNEIKDAVSKKISEFIYNRINRT